MEPSSPYSEAELVRLRNRVLPRLRQLHDLYRGGELGGTAHEVYPELQLESRENYLYFTLPAAINFQRKSEAMWESAYATYQDPETRFVFFPENASRGIAAYQQALTKYRLALLTNKHTHIWHTISGALRSQYESDPRSLLAKCGLDVCQIRDELARHRSVFPYLSGPKLSNYWLFLLQSFTNVRFQNREMISVIPDVHVIRCTAKLGLLRDNFDPRPELVAAIWFDLLADSEFAPCDLHSALWRWSRRGFLPEV